MSTAVVYATPWVFDTEGLFASCSTRPVVGGKGATIFSTASLYVRAHPPLRRSAVKIPLQQFYRSTTDDVFAIVLQKQITLFTKQKRQTTTESNEAEAAAAAGAATALVSPAKAASSRLPTFRSSVECILYSWRDIFQSETRNETGQTEAFLSQKENDGRIFKEEEKGGIRAKA